MDKEPYIPRGASAELFSVFDKEVLIEGPVRTGKTRSVLEWANLNAQRYPKSRILFLRKTRTSLTQSVLQTFERFVVDSTVMKASGSAKRAHRQSYFYPNGTEIVVGGLDDWSRVMSSEYDMICLFEAREVSLEDHESLLTRLSNFVMPFQQIICDTNPDTTYHWLNVRASSGQMKRLLSRLQDNPLFFHEDGTRTPIGHDYIEKNLEPLTGVRRQRLYLGKWAASEGTVYEGFDPEVHVIDKPKFGIRKYVVGVDWGFVDPGVMQVWGFDYDGRMYLVKEVYRTKQRIGDFWVPVAQKIMQAYKPDVFVCDSAAPGHISELCRHRIPAIGADKDIVLGVRRVQDRLKIQDDGHARLYLLRNALERVDPLLADLPKPKCTQDEFSDYSYPDPKEYKGSDEKPLDLNNHGMDALRYVAMYAEYMISKPLQVPYSPFD